MTWFRTFIVVLTLMETGALLGETPEEMLRKYEGIARRENAKFQGFNVTRGREFYLRREKTTKGDISCSTCHTTDPRQIGRTRANKDIEPLDPAVNSRRFTDPAHVEKWFRRNCDDVLQRPCTAQEKGDFMTYILSVK